MQNRWLKYPLLTAFVALTTYIFALACAEVDSDNNENSANSTNNTNNVNSTNNINSTNNVNSTNNSADQGRYRISVGTATTREGTWEFSAEGAGIASFTISGLPGTPISRNVMIEDLSTNGVTSKIDAIAVIKSDDSLVHTEYVLESQPGDAIGATGPADSDCIRPNLQNPGTRVFDMGGESAGGYAIFELLDWADNGDQIVVFEVGACDGANAQSDATGDFITEDSATAASLAVPYVDITSFEGRAQSWSAEESSILNATVYRCADAQVYGNYACEESPTELVRNLYIFTMRFPDIVQPSDQMHDLRYGLAVNWGGTDVKPADTDWDLYQGANGWFELSWDGNNWGVEAMTYSGATAVANDTTATRIRVEGNQVTYIVSAEEFSQQPTFKLVTMASEGANTGGDTINQNPTEPFVSF